MIALSFDRWTIGETRQLASLDRPAAATLAAAKFSDARPPAARLSLFSASHLCGAPFERGEIGPDLFKALFAIRARAFRDAVRGSPRNYSARLLVLLIVVRVDVAFFMGFYWVRSLNMAINAADGCLFKRVDA
jgi:hypothetical protein